MFIVITMPVKSKGFFQSSARLLVLKIKNPVTTITHRVTLTILYIQREFVQLSPGETYVCAFLHDTFVSKIVIFYNRPVHDVSDLGSCQNARISYFSHSFCFFFVFCFLMHTCMTGTSWKNLSFVITKYDVFFSFFILPPSTFHQLSPTNRPSVLRPKSTKVSYRILRFGLLFIIIIIRGKINIVLYVYSHLFCRYAYIFVCTTTDTPVGKYRPGAGGGTACGDACMLIFTKIPFT